MELYKPNKITINITPIKWLAGLLMGFLLLMNIYSWFNNTDLKNRNRSIQFKIDSLAKVNQDIEDKILQIELVNKDLVKNNTVLDSVLTIVNASEKAYRNRWYKLYKKLQDDQKNYNDSNRAKRDSLAAALAKR